MVVSHTEGATNFGKQNAFYGIMEIPLVRAKNSQSKFISISWRAGQDQKAPEQVTADQSTTVAVAVGVVVVVVAVAVAVAVAIIIWQQSIIAKWPKRHVHRNNRWLCVG